MAETKQVLTLPLPAGDGGTGKDNGSAVLTIPATGTAVLKSGTPLAGRVASWTDASQVQDAGFAASDVAKKNTANIFDGLQTINAPNVSTSALIVNDAPSGVTSIISVRRGGEIAFEVNRVGNIVNSPNLIVGVFNIASISAGENISYFVKNMKIYAGYTINVSMQSFGGDFFWKTVVTVSASGGLNILDATPVPTTLGTPSSGTAAITFVSTVNKQLNIVIENTHGSTSLKYCGVKIEVLWGYTSTGTNQPYIEEA